MRARLDPGGAHEGRLPRCAARRVRAAAHGRGRRRAGRALLGTPGRRAGHRHRDAADAVEGQPVLRRGRRRTWRRRMPDARFVIVGEGELQPELEAQARQLGIADRFAFAGFQRDVAAVYSAFDVAVFPSLWEGTPADRVRGARDGQAHRVDRRRRPERHPDARARRADRAASATARPWPTPSSRCWRDPAQARRAGRGRTRDRAALRHRPVRAPHGAALRPAARDLARDEAAGYPHGRPAVPDRGRRWRTADPRRRGWRDPGYIACAVVGAAAAGVRGRRRLQARGVRLPERRRDLLLAGLQPRARRRLRVRAQGPRARVARVPDRARGHLPEEGEAGAASARRAASRSSWSTSPDTRDDRLYYAQVVRLPAVRRAVRAALRHQRVPRLPRAAADRCAWRAATRGCGATSPPGVAFGYAFAFLFASAAPVYLVWLTPELFNLGAGASSGTFLWSYKLVAPPSAGGAVSGRWLRGPRRPTSPPPCCIGIATFSKPLQHPRARADAAASGVWQRRWRGAVRTGVVCAVDDRRRCSWRTSRSRASSTTRAAIATRSTARRVSRSSGPARRSTTPACRGRPTRCRPTCC